MTVQALKLQHTEEVLEPSVTEGIDVDLWQYEKKDFTFFSEALYRRSINRVATPSEREKYPLHPLDCMEVVLGRTSEQQERESVIRFPEVFKARVYGEKSVSTLQEWECIIEDVVDEKVISQAISLIDVHPDTNILTIPLAEFSPTDRPRLQPGVVFRLIVGFAKKANGARSREAIIYLRNHLKHLPTEKKFDFSGL